MCFGDQVGKIQIRTLTAEQRAKMFSSGSSTSSGCLVQPLVADKGKLNEEKGTTLIVEALTKYGFLLSFSLLLPIQDSSPSFFALLVYWLSYRVLESYSGRMNLKTIGECLQRITENDISMTNLWSFRHCVLNGVRMTNMGIGPATPLKGLIHSLIGFLLLGHPSLTVFRSSRNKGSKQRWGRRFRCRRRWL